MRLHNISAVFSLEPQQNLECHSQMALLHLHENASGVSTFTPSMSFRIPWPVVGIQQVLNKC